MKKLFEIVSKALFFYFLLYIYIKELFLFLKISSPFYSSITSFICDFIKFGLSEKHTKFEKKKILMVLTNQLIYLVNVKTMRKIFSNYVCFSKSPNLFKLSSYRRFKKEALNSNCLEKIHF